MKDMDSSSPTSVGIMFIKIIGDIIGVMAIFGVPYAILIIFGS